MELLKLVFSSEFAALASAVVWSVTVILLRVSGLKLAPVPLTFFKSAVALICFALTAVYLGLVLMPDLTTIEYLRLVLSAILGISIADTLFVAALNRLGASLQALADCIYAPSVAAVGFVMFGESLSSLEIIGGCLVLGGVAVGVGLRLDGTAERRGLIQGVALAAAAHVIMAVGILMVRDILREQSVVWVCAFRFLIATVVLGLYAGYKRDEVWAGFKATELYPWTITLSVLGPYLATILWASGFKYTTPGRAAIYNQLSTVFVIILARVFLAEQLTKRKIAGVILAAGGSILVALS